MKKITTNQILLGGAILGLIYILYKSSLDKEKTNQAPQVNLDPPKIEEKENDKDEAEEEDVTKGVPKECLNGFELNGFKYNIENNKFVKNKIK